MNPKTVKKHGKMQFRLRIWMHPLSLCQKRACSRASVGILQEVSGRQAEAENEHGKEQGDQYLRTEEIQVSWILFGQDWYGDDGSDYNLYGVPDSFEGLVKDSKQMSNLYLYGGAWKGEDGGTLISDTNDDGDEVRFALYDAGEELTASGFIQFVPDYDYDYFYNEHDGVAYRSWFDEVGALHVAELGTFTQMTGDAPGENTGDIDFEMMAGTWYLDAEADAPSILVFDENGGWELLERPGGDGDPTTVDSGTVELAPDGSEEMYLAVSSQFDDVGYEFTILDHDTLRWGSEFEFYQKMA